MRHVARKLCKGLCNLVVEGCGSLDPRSLDRLASSGEFFVCTWDEVPKMAAGRAAGE